jgi:ABC-type lipoprotein export system ATPase subunit
MASDLDPVVIAVMGASGSGKSTFIWLATGNENVAIGHSLFSGVFDI